jgi:hypothetical protein
VVDLLTEALSVASGAEWDETPVEIEEFVTSEEFLDLPPLSHYQYQIVRAASQIYRKETLIALYGRAQGEKRWDETCTEVILQLGKGSGKDFTSTIAVCYIVYLLLCLKDPSHYYGRPRNDAIDIINIAINADQAKNVFFKGLREKVEHCPWFRGKYSDPGGGNKLEFDKNITVYSGHSQREAFEGLNLLVAILDEISGFALESNTGNDLADTADATYQMYRASVDSRFNLGKVILLSFPRFRGDYIQQRYGGFDDPDKGIMGAVAEKETVLRTHTFKLHEDLPDGIEGNEFTIEWEEDHILRYSFEGLFALRRPTWEVNPTKTIEDFKRAFYTNKADALGRFACMPSDSTDDTLFKNKQAIEESFVSQNGVDQDGIFAANFQANPEKEYFVHVDLSKVHDRCAIAMAHVDKWIAHEGDKFGDLYPVVRVDAIRWWKPSKDNPMDYKEVIDFIIALRRRGFKIKLVTFDRWNSHDTMNALNTQNIETEMLSVKTEHYDDFLNIVYDGRLIGPRIDELITELRELRRFMKGEKVVVDHPRSGYKDLSDAVCGAIQNAIERTLKPASRTVEVMSYKKMAQQHAPDDIPDGVIRPPKKRPMPDDLAQDLHRISLDKIRII